MPKAKITPEDYPKFISLYNEDLSIGELSEVFGVTAPTIQKYIRIIKELQGIDSSI